MDRIYQDAKDKNVALNVIYVNGSGVACYDSDATQPIGADNLMELFKKGVVVFDEGTYFKPVSAAVVEGVATLLNVDGDGNVDPIVSGTEE